MKPRLAALILFAMATYLGLARLDNTAFWDDEAEVGIVARNLLTTGRLTGWDGRNLFAYRNGATLDQNLRPINPPLQFLVAAASFKMFGVSTWSGRFPFALAGLTALAVFALVLREEFPAHGPLWLYALGSLALSMAFLLNIRQCRYYALSLLFAVLTFYFYRRGLRTKRLADGVWLGVSAALLFYSHYLGGAAFLLALATAHLMFHRHECAAGDWRGLMLAVGIFLMATVPYALAFSIWERPDLEPHGAWFARKITLIWWHLRDFNLLGCLPWTLAFALLGFLFAARREPAIVRPLWTWVALCAGFLLILAMLSPGPNTQAGMADLRYLLPIVPFLAGLSGAGLWFLHRRSRWAALAVFIVSGSSNLLMLAPGHAQPRWHLPAFLAEIHRANPTSYQAAVEYLERNSRTNDVVFAAPEYCSFPLMFYLGDRLRFGGLVNADTPLSQAKLHALDAPLFFEETFPDWLLMFGLFQTSKQQLDFFSRPHQAGGLACQFKYRPVKTLNVYWFDTSRPELPWHTFGPKQDFHPMLEAVHVFKREPVTPPGAAP